MQTGKVKFFNVTKGFGFIKVDQTNEEIFVHASGLVDEIKEEDKVSFEVTEGRKGKNAVNVKKGIAVFESFFGNGICPFFVHRPRRGGAPLLL